MQKMYAHMHHKLLNAATEPANEEIYPMFSTIHRQTNALCNMKSRNDIIRSSRLYMIVLIQLIDN